MYILILFSILFLVISTSIYRSNCDKNLKNLNNLKIKKNQYVDYDKVILLILNCKKYSHKREKQLENWIKNIPKNLKYYHVIGEENLEEDYIFDHSQKILYVKCKDDYPSLPRKVILSYQAIDENFDYKYIFKTDDDQEIKQYFWNLIISNLKEDVNYGGFFSEYRNDTKLGCEYYEEHPDLPLDLEIEKSTFCGGRFYLLSNANVKNLLSIKDKFEDRVLEDQSVGLLMEDKYKKNGLYFNIDKYFETKY